MHAESLPAAETATEVRRRWQSGDREGAYALAVRATGDSLYRFLRHMLRDEEETREMFQETYLRVFRSLGGFRGDAGLTTWVLTIGRNAALNRIRARRTHAGREASLDDPEFPEPAGAGAGPAPLTRSLLGAMDALPPAQREAVLLFYVEDLSIESVAALTGRPANTVKSDLSRARKTLKRALEEREARRAHARAEEP